MQRAKLMASLISMLLAAYSMTSVASASETAKLNVSLIPDKLASSTTIITDLKIGTTSGAVPSPVIGAEFRFPAGFAMDTSTLGLAVCQPKALIERGLKACSPNALMGYGHAAVELEFASEIIREPVKLAVLMAEPIDNHTGL